MSLGVVAGCRLALAIGADLLTFESAWQLRQKRLDELAREEQEMLGGLGGVPAAGAGLALAAAALGMAAPPAHILKSTVYHVLNS